MNKQIIRNSLEVVMELAKEYKEPDRSEEEFDKEIMKFMKSKHKMSTKIDDVEYYLINYKIKFTSRELRKHCYRF